MSGAKSWMQKFESLEDEARTCLMALDEKEQRDLNQGWFY